MPSLPSPRAVWLALLFVPGLLHAEDADPQARFGLQATVASPRQDLRDITPRTGLGGGCFWEQDLNATWSLRTRIDYVSFRESTARTQAVLPSLAPTQALKVACDQASIGMEGRFHPRELKNFFLLGGAFGTRVEFKTVLPGDPTTQPATLPSWDKQKTSFKLGLAGGVGYQVCPGLAVTVRLTTANLGGVLLGTLEGGIEYRF